MELRNSFVVGLPVDEAWDVLIDLERVAPCMPGAQLTEIEGDEYRGVVKVKVGPIVAKYEGTATMTSLDEEGRKATIAASGRDLRQGNADVVITASLRPAAGGSTAVDLATDLSLSGKVASFGKGAIEDVSANILAQFTANLEDMLAADAEAEAPRPASPETTEGPRRVEGLEAEPIDLAATVAAPMLKRALPAVTLVGLVLILAWLLLRRRRR